MPGSRGCTVLVAGPVPAKGRNIQLRRGGDDNLRAGGEVGHLRRHVGGTPSWGPSFPFGVGVVVGGGAGGGYVEFSQALVCGAAAKRDLDASLSAEPAFKRVTTTDATPSTDSHSMEVSRRLCPRHTFLFICFLWSPHCWPISTPERNFRCTRPCSWFSHIVAGGGGGGGAPLHCTHHVHASTSPPNPRPYVFPGVFLPISKPLAGLTGGDVGIAVGLGPPLLPRPRKWLFLIKNFPEQIFLSQPFWKHITKMRMISPT